MAADETTLGNALAEAFATALRQSDTIAVPGFGSFVPVKHDEHIDTLADGRRILVPPHIAIEFRAGSMLRKHLRNNEQ